MPFEKEMLHPINNFTVQQLDEHYAFDLIYCVFGDGVCIELGSEQQ